MPPGPKPSSPLQLRDRDLALLSDLFESRVMTAAHIAALHFNGSTEAAKKRLQKIKAAGLIRDRKRRVNEPAILFLTRKGFGVLQSHGVLSAYPSLGPTSFEKRVPVGELTLRHELEVMDVKAAFCAALSNTPHFSVAQFSTWPLLYEFTACPSDYGAEVTVKPDGYISVHEEEPDGIVSAHAFFLEVDRSSETQDTLVNRASCYMAYYRSGGFAEWCGGDSNRPEEYPFRVLMIFKTAERRNNTAERLLQQNKPVRTQVYLTTLPEMTKSPLGPIWVRPCDYEVATDGTPFDPHRTTSSFVYRRQPARELLVEQRMKKLRLFDDSTDSPDHSVDPSTNCTKSES